MSASAWTKRRAGAWVALLVVLATVVASCGSARHGDGAAGTSAPTTASSSSPPRRGGGGLPAAPRVPLGRSVVAAVQGRGPRTVQLPVAARRAGDNIAFYWTCAQPVGAATYQAFALGGSSGPFARSGCGPGATFGASPPRSMPTPMRRLTIRAAATTRYWLDIVIGRVTNTGGTLTAPGVQDE